jgi:uncharacterized membrane protein (DUF106 family)
MYASEGREMSLAKAEADLEKARAQVCQDEEREARKKGDENALEERKKMEAT